MVDIFSLPHFFPILGNPKKNRVKENAYVDQCSFEHYDRNFRNYIVFFFFRSVVVLPFPKRVDNAIICQNTVVKRLHVWNLCERYPSMYRWQKNTAKGFFRNYWSRGRPGNIRSCLMRSQPTACDHLLSAWCWQNRCRPSCLRKSKKSPGTPFLPDAKMIEVDVPLPVLMNAASPILCWEVFTTPSIKERALTVRLAFLSRRRGLSVRPMVVFCLLMRSANFILSS